MRRSVGLVDVEKCSVGTADSMLRRTFICIHIYKTHITRHTSHTHIHTHTYTQELNDFRATRQHRAACDQALSTVSTAVASRSTLELLSTISSQVCSAVLCVVQCCV
jgi:hypothetical protein